MIELRWLRRSPVPYGEAETVLQYRNYECAGMDDSGAPHFTGRWLNWEDVPVCTDKHSE